MRILSQLRFGGAASRAQMARQTGLDAKTITNICNSLLSDRLIISEKACSPKRGRPSEQLQINPDAAFAIGVDIGAQQVTAVIKDLKGNLRLQWRQEFTSPKKQGLSNQTGLHRN